MRAHSSPVDPQAFLNARGTGAHVEYLAQILINALFVSQSHRADASLTIVLESSSDYSRALEIRGERLGTLESMAEEGCLELIADALYAGAGLGKEQQVLADNGVLVETVSFERLVKRRLEEKPVYLLDRKGADIRSAGLKADCCFVLTDHVPLPRKAKKSLIRQGATPISLGPVMLHASQCVVLVQNEVDRLYSRS